MIMTSNRNKYQKARRRLSAVTFLSNISLDGTFRDTDLCQIANKSKNDKTDLGSKTGPSHNDKELLINGSRGYKVYSPIQRIGQESSAFSDSECHPIATTIIGIGSKFRERCSSTNTESFKEKLTSRAKKSHFISLGITGISTDDKSSSESLTFGRFRTSSGYIPENRILTRDMRFARHSKGVSFREQRIVFALAKGVPCVVFSTIPYYKVVKNSKGDHRKDGVRRRNNSTSRPLSLIADNGLNPFLERDESTQEISYSKLLIASRVCTREQYRKMYEGDYNDKGSWRMLRNPHIIARTKLLTRHKDKKWCFSYESSQRGHKGASPPRSSIDVKSFNWDDQPLFSHKFYCPNVLDDPELIAGKHRTLLTFTSYMTSIIDYVRPQDLKKELNDKFREKFPHIQLTLSKLRSIKKEMRKIAKQDSGGVDLLSVAQAYVYFEKLILSNLINKDNRKLCAGACLMLSAKLNDVKGEMLKSLIERIESTFRLNRKDLIRFEFSVLVALEFGLHVPPYEVFPHYQRLLHET